MDISDNCAKECSRRLLMSRMRLLSSRPFYGLLLMHMRFALDTECETAYTDGVKIAFSPEFMGELSDNELDFVLMHEIMHVALFHCFRGLDGDPYNFNVACDIVVNSNIMNAAGNASAITLSNYGVSMHIAPDGKEGYLYTAEEVYAMLPSQKKKRAEQSNDGSNGDEGGDRSDPNAKKGKKGKSKAESGNGGWDDHSHWSEGDQSDVLDEWKKHLNDAATVLSIEDPSNSCGSVPVGVQRLLERLRRPQLDWRSILNDFVQEEICDYSFSPPDRRFGDSPFFLPDFNEKDEKVENILFMVDTSGSMSDSDILAAYTEISGALEQFKGKLSASLGFFDAKVYDPIPFDNVNDLIKIRPIGGGGTNFHVVFDYVKDNLLDDPPKSIIILTDGYADFPKEKAAFGIPVLWLINNKDVTPPWGKIARISSPRRS